MRRISDIDHEGCIPTMGWKVKDITGGLARLDTI
jgi:hypothetical protein